jgi:hypothetical protein
MDAAVFAQMFGVVIRGAVVPIVWIIGIALIIGGVVSLFRGRIAAGLVLVIVGILLGGLNVV